jgi:hypothetical protein
MVRFPRWMALLGGICASCAPGPELAILGFPPAPSATSFVFAIETGDRIALYGEEVASNTPVIQSMPYSGTVQVEALAWTESLASLHLAAGPIMLAAPGDPNAIELGSIPRTLPSFVARVQSGGTAAWSLSSAPSSAVESLRVPGPTPSCPTITNQMRATVSATDSVSFGVPLSRDLAVVGSFDGKIFTATSSGVVHRVRTPTLPGRLFGGTRIGSELYVVSGEQILRGRLDTSSTTMNLEVVTSSFAHKPARVWAAGGPDTSGGSELYIMENSGSLSRVDPVSGAVTRVFAFPPRGDGEGAIIRVAPGEYFAVQDNEASILHVIGGALTTEDPMPPAGGFGGLAQIPGLGFVACSTKGALFLRQQSGQSATWQQIPGNTGLGLGSCVVQPYGNGGLLFAGDQGFVGSYSTSSGVCAAQPLVGFTVDAAFVLGGEIVMTGDFSGANPALEWVTVSGG